MKVEIIFNKQNYLILLLNIVSVKSQNMYVEILTFVLYYLFPGRGQKLLDFFPHCTEQKNKRQQPAVEAKEILKAHDGKK